MAMLTITEYVLRYVLNLWVCKYRLQTPKYYILIPYPLIPRVYVKYKIPASQGTRRDGQFYSLT